MANAVVALHEELSEWLVKRAQSGKGSAFRPADGGRHGFLALAVRETFVAGDPTYDLLRSVRPEATQAAALEISRADVDAPNLLNSLAELALVLDQPMANVAAALATEVPVLATELVNSGEFKSGSLREWARLGARALLPHEGPKALAIWPRHRLSEGSVAVLVREARGVLRADIGLRDTMSQATQRLADCASQLHEASLDGQEGGSARFTEWLYPDVWRCRRALRRARQGRDGAVQMLAFDLVRATVASSLKRALTPVFGPVEDVRRDTWAVADEVAQALGTTLAAHGFVVKVEHHPMLAGLLSDSVRASFADYVARATAREVLGIHQSSYLSAIGDWIDDGLRASPSEDRDSSDEYRTTDTAAQAGLAAAVEQEVVRVAEAQRRVLQEVVDGSLRTWHEPSTWRIWETSIRACARTHRDAWEHVHWGRFDAQQLRDAFRPLGLALSENFDFDVVLPVYGLAAGDASWSTDQLAWYTPGTRSFGEDLGTASKQGEIRVHQRVSGSSAATAVERARARLEPSLSAVSFALSVEQQVSGFRPELGSWSFAGDRRRGWSTQDGRRTREATHDPGSLTQVEEFTRRYAPLTDVEPVTQSEVALRLLRGLFWYRSGRWQTDPVRRFLDHFVALEHIFVDGQRSKDELVGRGVAKLFGSFRRRGFLFGSTVNGTASAAHALAELVRNETPHSAAAAAADVVAATHPWSADWRTDLLPWLSPRFVRAVATLLPAELDRTPWESHALALDHLASTEPQWQRRDHARAADYEFRLRLLARRRHVIVHEAMTFARGIEHEASALTEIVEEVLTSLAEAALSRPLSVRTTGEWADTMVAPWLR